MKLSLVIQCALISAMILSSTGCQMLNPNKSSSGKRSGVRGFRKAKAEAADDFDPMRARGDRVLLEDLAPGQFGATVRSRSFAGEDREESQRYFQEGQQLFTKATSQQNADPNGTGHHEIFSEAATKFRLAASRWRDSSMEEDALFHEAESLFFANRYVQANRTYEHLIGSYSGSKYLDKSEAKRFKIAEYWLKLSESGAKFSIGDPTRPKIGLATEAKRILHRIRIDDPTGKLADDATMALANAYFANNQFQDAADTYEDLRRNYPGSTHMFHAHMLELKARMEAYRGPSYDDEPLVKADELLKTIMRSFPEQVAEQKEYLAQEAATIRSQLAGRDLGMARYFEGRGENRAASIIYEQVAENYQDTDFVNDVQQQIATLKKKPPTPKQRGKWLVDLFPDPEAQRPVIAAGDNDRKILR